jgi:glycosyltransferase involved in cell wall biosynthesis
MKYKKICILTSVHPVFDTRIFYKEAQTLSDAAYDVVLIGPHDKKEIRSGIKIIPLFKPKNRIERFFKTSLSLYRKALLEKADIYHFHDPELIPLMLLLKIKAKAKIIYDVHEDFSKKILARYWLPKKIRGLVAYLFGKLEKKISEKFDFIIVATLKIKERFDLINIEVIKNYPKLFGSNLQKDPSVTGKKNILRVIYTGGLAKHKGIYKILQALTYISQGVVLDVYGKSSDKEFERKIIDLKNKYHLNMNYRGRISYKQIYEEMRRSDVGVVCNQPKFGYNESLPNKLFEYMSAGLPVIASDFVEWKEIIEGNGAGFCVEPTDPREIAEAIQYIAQHSKRAKEMGKNGRKAIIEKYNWKEEGDKLLKIYEKLLK